MTGNAQAIVFGASERSGTERADEDSLAHETRHRPVERRVARLRPILGRGSGGVNARMRRICVIG
jgi:hypothetical protein